MSKDIQILPTLHVENFVITTENILLILNVSMA